MDRGIAHPTFSTKIKIISKTLIQQSQWLRKSFVLREMEDKQKESKNPKLNFIRTIATLEKPNGSGTCLVSLEQTTFLFNQKIYIQK